MDIKKTQEKTTLGTCIKMERKRSGLTQAQLGKLIGLSESRVSKIENGAPITPEVASFILGKMGSSLQFNVVHSIDNDRDSISYLISSVYHHSNIKKVPLSKSFSYLKNLKGLDYLIKYREIEQTLSYEEIVSDVSKVCANFGGIL